MDPIFRAPIITPLAALSTTAATSAQSQPNFNVPLPLSAQTPFQTPPWTLAPVLPAQLAWHQRPQPPSNMVPFSQTAWLRPADPLPAVRFELLRNGLVLPVPVVPTGPPFIPLDWPLPARLPLKPETHLFYYMQDQTRPAFIQYDWPKAPRLPTVTTPPIRNEILFPFAAVAPPFRQREWPTPSRRQLAKDHQPEQQNVFLVPPVGLPTHQTDWPRPHGAKSLQGSYTQNDLGLLTLPILHPVRPIDWPNPRTVPNSSAARCPWDEHCVSFLLTPAFRPEWAADINQLIGPDRTQPETH